MLASLTAYASAPIHHSFAPTRASSAPSSGVTFTHPRTPYEPATRPIGISPSGSLLCKLLDEALRRRRELRALPGPVLDPLHVDAQRLAALRRLRIVEPQPLDELARRRAPRISNHHVIERALVRAAALQSNHHHGKKPRKPRKGADYTGLFAPATTSRAGFVRHSRAGATKAILGSSSETRRMASWVKVHPLVVRITHWINALAILVMVASGWRIYNASPLFESFTFPKDLTLGGWLAGALQWHFAAMWLLALNGLVYVVYRILAGHFRRQLLPISRGALLSDVGAALRGRLAHDDLRVYNAAQRAAYLGAIVLGVVLILSGLVIWKPVQFYSLGLLMGDYEGARYVHFFAMALLLLFVAVHVLMVLLVP